MLVETPVSVDQMHAQNDVPPVSSVDDMFDAPTELPSDSQSDLPAAEDSQAANVATETQPASPELSEEDEAERRWWAKVDVLGKIRDCSRLIEEYESEIDGYQESIKEAKEVLKGQQALLSRYSSQLADIIDGKPLPKNPNAPAAATGELSGTLADGTAISITAESSDWRDKLTEELLKGCKGLGDKKLEAIVEVAPTAGQLEDLRGQASMRHQSFKEVLPKGCGESLAEEIERRLEDHIRDWSRNQPEDPQPETEYEDVE